MGIATGVQSVILNDALNDGPMGDGLFEGLTEDNKTRLRNASRPMSFRAGQHIFRQGAVHEGIYILQEGIVRTYYVAPNGREITLAHWSVPNFVGGPELFGGGEHVWSGLAKTDVRVLYVPGSALRALVAEIPALAISILDGVVGKARCYSVVLQMLGTRSVMQRLAYYLLLHAERTADGSLVVDTALKQADIATIVGSTRQWVSSTLERFRVKGLIEIDTEGRITIMNQRDLTEIAET